MTISLECQAWLALLTKWEGKGKSNRAADLGGETWFGITVKNHPEILLVPSEQREAKAREIAISYWNAVHGDEIERPLDIVLVDWTFNSKRSMVVERLQRLVGTEPDGILGPNTLAAIRSHIEAHRPDGAIRLARALHLQRVLFLHDLIRRVPSQNKNRGGWWVRTTELAFELA